MINRLYKQRARYLYLVVDREIIYSCLKPVWPSGISMGFSSSQKQKEKKKKKALFCKKEKALKRKKICTGFSVVSLCKVKEGVVSLQVA